jgi:hypothetical protein
MSKVLVSRQSLEQVLNDVEELERTGLLWQPAGSDGDVVA